MAVCIFGGCHEEATLVLWPVAGGGRVAFTVKDVPHSAAWRKRWGWDAPTHCVDHARALATPSRVDTPDGGQ